MAIRSLIYVPGSLKSTTNNLYQRTYAVQLQADFDAAPTTAAIKTAVDPSTSLAVPAIGATWNFRSETDLGAFCQSVGVTAVHEGPDSYVYNLDVEYGPLDITQFPSNPIDWPLRVSTQTVYRERAADFDVDGTPIRNSAKQRFGDPVTLEYGDYVITCKRNELVSAFDLGLAYDYQNTINDATWNAFPARTVLCRSITAGEEQYDSTAKVWFCTVTYVFETNRDTWRRRLLDQGFCELDSSSPPRAKRITGPDGQPLDEPVPLDGSGHRLATDATPVTLTFDVFAEVDFTIFDIDLSNRLGM